MNTENIKLDSISKPIQLMGFVSIGLKPLKSEHHTISSFKRVIELYDLLASAPS